MMRWLLVFVLAAQLSAADRHVIVMSIDGFSADALADPKLAIPNLRRLVREGAWVERLQVVNPSVTWPNHTSMVTGVTPATHGVLFNGLAVREGGRVRVEPWRPKTEMVRVPTVYDLAHQAGLTTAEVDWVAVYKAPTITWSFPELPGPDGTVAADLVAAGVLTAEELANFGKAPITWRDQIWTQAAIHILEKHKPNLLLFHLLTTDSVQHRYGPEGLAAPTALALADARLGELLAAVTRAGLRDRTTILVVSDHGFKSVKALLRPRLNGAYLISEGGTAMVYITAADKRAAAARLKRELAESEGIDRVVDETAFQELGLPAPEAHPGMADLILAAKDGYAFANGEGRTVTNLAAPQGAHGYLNTDRSMNGILVAWGADVKQTCIPEARMVDIAPTIARLLGLTMENIEGKAIAEILK